jgi:murein endopeptidase
VSSRRLIAAAALVPALSGLGTAAQGETPSERRSRLEREIVWRHSTAEGRPDAGRLVSGVKLPPEGVNFTTWDPIRWRPVNRFDRRFATDRLIRTILRVARQYRAAHPGAPRILVGDLSRPRGGSFDGRYGSLREFNTRAPSGGHDSHQNGRDADIYYPRKDRKERAPGRWADVDRRLAQDLVNRFAAAGAQFVFVGPRTGLSGKAGVVQQLDYHHDHLHVRLR